MLIGIDWGGTKIEAIALDHGGATLARRRIATPQHDYPACVSAVRDLVLGIERELDRVGSVGIGIPGAISPATGLVKNANSIWLNGQSLDKDLERALARPVRVENDANCLAVSEAADGAGAGAGVVWAAILGTGVGSGIAINGKAWAGPHSIAGEWGHNPLPQPRDDERPGPPCYCGRRGCIETFVSGPGLSADHARRTDLTLSPEAIVIAMRSGQPQACETYRRFVDCLGRGIAHVVNILDPEVIVLGGGLSEIDELYADLPARVAPHVFSDRFATPVRKSAHGPSSGVRGAAWLWRESRHRRGA